MRTRFVQSRPCSPIPKDGEAIFEDGVNAFGLGLTRDQCPYPLPSQQSEDWLAGWGEAEDAVEDDEDDE